jgi:calcium-dependent protein kinase
MGICSKAKDIIYSSKLCDVNLHPKDKAGDNLIVNSIPNTNNNTFNIDNNVINVVNINNPIIKNEKESNAQLNQNNNINQYNNDNENKDIVDLENHFQKKVSKKKKKKKYNNTKKALFGSSKDVLIKLDFDINNTQNNEKNSSKNNLNLENNDDSNNNKPNEIQEKKSPEEKKDKFKGRNKKKYGTHIHHHLPEKLSRIEMTIPVFQESLITQNFGNPDKYYKKLRNLGSGSYGTVYLAKNILKENLVAIKVIEKVPSNIIDDMEIKNEINILKSLSHPNIVKIYEFFDTAVDYYIVTEYCKKGELFDYINNKYSERQLAVLFYQVFSGLCYLHEKKILHRDLKLENLMISEIEKDINTGEEYFWMKIIDFGTAKIFERKKKEKEIIGSSYYIAPEVLKKNYNEKCDTWSVGVILYMTLTGVPPFDGETDEDIIHRIKIGKYSKTNKRFLEHSPEVIDLVNSLLERNIDKRLSAKQALEHQWFKKFGGRNLFCNFNKEEIMPYIDNLFQYKYNSKLQELVIAFLVHNLSLTDETLIILKMFRFFNKAGDCKLTKSEFTLGLYGYKNKEEVDEMADIIFQRLDGDNNGYIEYEEFLRACVDKTKLMTKENLKYAFKFLDHDNTKTLNVKNIIDAFITKPNKEIETIFMITLKEVDKEGKGIIKFN